MYNNYIEELISGKQIRIKFNKKNYDHCEDDGWWSEELWCYDPEIKLFKCYYPVSSYEKDFYTTHTQSETESFFREDIRDSDERYDDVTVTDIIIEDCNNSKSIKEIAIEKVKNMTDEEINLLFTLLNYYFNNK